VNNSYEIALHRIGSRPQDDPPWYCWEAGISTAQSASARGFASNPAPVDHTFAQAFARSAFGSEEFLMCGRNNRGIVDNREGVIAGHTHSKGENLVEGKKAPMLPVAIRDNIEATGVDAISITVEEDDPGYQNRKWGQCANLDRMQERISKKRVLRPLAEKRGQIARPHRRPYDKAG